MTYIADCKDFGFQKVIHYRGVIDFDGLYKYIYKWITTHDFDFFETEAEDKPPYRIYKMYGRKKVSFYVMLTLNVDIWLWDAKEVEIIRDGVRKKMTDVRMKLIVNCGYVTDYDGDFERSVFLKKVENFINNHVMYHDIFIKYFDYIDYFSYDLMTDIKKYLEMETATNAY